MKKIVNPLEIIGLHYPFHQKTIIDMGCGTGDLVRILSQKGARVIGLDNLFMLNKAREIVPTGRESYVCGVGEHFPFKTSIADMIILFASLHHVPEIYMTHVLSQCHSVLKPKGTAIILEPVGIEDSYFDIVSLVEDERLIQQQAYEAIKQADDLGLVNKSEYTVYFERSFADYENLINTFVEEDENKKQYIEKAKTITQTKCNQSGIKFNDFRYKSIARVNILEKKTN